MSWWILILPLSWFLVWEVLGRKIEDILKTSIIWTLYLVFLTELLSIFKFLTWQNCLWGWIVLTILLLILILNGKYPKLQKIRLGRSCPAICMWGFGLLMFILGLVGMMAPVNTSDALTYHAARVLHWVANKSVDFYPTNITRQIYLSPGTEYIATHVWLLGKYEGLWNLIQWWACIGCLVTVWLITKELGGNFRSCWLALSFGLFLPITIMEVNSTQNDFVATVWLLIFIYFGLKRNWSFMAAAISLGILTKATNYFFASPFVFWFGFDLWKVKGKQSLQTILLMTAIFMSVNGGFFARNMKLFGTPITDFPQTVIVNGRFSILGAGSNFVKNIFMHLYTPWPIINQGVRTVHAAINMLTFTDINDPDFDNPGYSVFATSTYINEDVVTNTVQMVVLLYVIWYLLSKQEFGNRLKIYTYLTLIGMFLLSLIVRWTPWNGRYHLGWFWMLSPIVGIVIDKLATKMQIIILNIIFVLIAVAYMVYNPSKPWIEYGAWPMQIGKTSIDDLRWGSYPDKNYAGAYKKISNLIVEKGYRKIGLVVGELQFEYPFWSQLWERNYEFEIEHLGVENVSKDIPRPEFTPDLVIYCKYCGLTDWAPREFGDKAKTISEFPPFVVYGMW